MKLPGAFFLKEKKSVPSLNILFLFFWLRLAACGILVPRPGIEPVPSTVRAQSPNHWTTREFLPSVSFMIKENI